ncbi:hypothetical protein L3X37_10465 [Sabulilitoribacter arenilitoris]|uniref:Uncharacterized protein n=1 Tax=Wocania arenilitoris TaxID=2044858 RepID=A0AAE3ENP1_9FLAO|nr:hypothetical protein [Wocania arenilitoris]MCF7568783.1 hypothetical protein [Wocania arenilitoris]
MQNLNLFIRFFLIANMCLHPILGFGQQVKNVPEAFESLSVEPKIILINNQILVPTEGGHMQGVQVIEKNGKERLLISGSSLTKAYILQADLTTLKTDTLIILRQEPYRHAGGIQASEPYLVVGIEDNVIKKSSKVCLYNYHNTNLSNAQSNITIDREGEAKHKTAGATGLLALDNNCLIVVSNWDSRNWDFYRTNPKKNEYKMLESFAAPDDWASYQSINLIMDEEAIYAIGFYRKELVDSADLILVSKRGTFNLIMEKVLTKIFNSKNGVDFGTAAGLQVDKKGKLHVWATQSDALKKITVNQFSQL